MESNARPIGSSSSSSSSESIAPFAPFPGCLGQKIVLSKADDDDEEEEVDDVAYSDFCHDADARRRDDVVVVAGFTENDKIPRILQEADNKQMAAPKTEYNLISFYLFRVDKYGL
jgi:hypothetical protein